jgi:hypothetical protein
MDQPVGGGEVDAALPVGIGGRRKACMNVQGAWFPVSDASQQTQRNSGSQD